MNAFNFDFNVINPLFIFFVTLGGNFVAPLFPCQVQRLFTISIFLHFLFYFLQLCFLQKRVKK